MNICSHNPSKRVARQVRINRGVAGSLVMTRVGLEYRLPCLEAMSGFTLLPAFIAIQRLARPSVLPRQVKLALTGSAKYPAEFRWKPPQDPSARA
jgi:hypothetical protein